jgi:hypothetical protein
MLWACDVTGFTLARYRTARIYIPATPGERIATRGGMRRGEL